jgi:hypothetical protein
MWTLCMLSQFHHRVHLEKSLVIWGWLDALEYMATYTWRNSQQLETQQDAHGHLHVDT